MTTIYQYRIYCETEQLWKTTYGPEPPTTCPTNTAHTVNLDSVAITEKITHDKVIVEQPTTGYFMMDCVTLDVPGGTPGATTIHDVDFDTNILLWLTIIVVTDEMVGDVFSVVTNPDTLVGGLTVGGNIGDTILNVSPTVTANVVTRMYLTVHDNTASPPVSQDLGRVLNVDSDAGTVTMQNALTSNFPAGSTLTLTMYFAKDLVLSITGKHEFGNKGFESKHVPAGTVFRFHYTNNTGTTKKVYWYIGYYFGV